MNTISIFKKIAIAEGISFLLLVFIAMPLKYFADAPEAVKYTGWAHGVLFILYIIFFFMAWDERRWKFGKAVLIGMAALLPVAPFFVHNEIDRER